MTVPGEQDTAMTFYQPETASAIDSLVKKSHMVEAAVLDTAERVDDTCEMLSELASRLAELQSADS